MEGYNGIIEKILSDSEAAIAAATEALRQRLQTELEQALSDAQLDNDPVDAVVTAVRIGDELTRLLDGLEEIRLIPCPREKEFRAQLEIFQLDYEGFLRLSQRDPNRFKLQLKAAYTLIGVKAIGRHIQGVINEDIQPNVSRKLSPNHPTQFSNLEMQLIYSDLQNQIKKRVSEDEE